MAETCIVPNCNSGRETSANRIAFFNIPENVELRNKWIQAIPISGVPVNSTDMVCEKHFIETDIIRHYIVQDAAGKVVEKVAYDYPRLSDTAVPMIFPGLPLRVNEAQIINPITEVQNVPQSSSQNVNNALYDCMVLDMYTDLAADVIKGGASVIGHVAHHTQHKTEPEVVSHVANHASESQPLLSTEAIQSSSSPANGVNIPSPANDVNISSPANGVDISSPVNGAIPSSDAADISSPVSGDIFHDAAKISSPVNGDAFSDVANHSTNAVDVVLSNDIPVTAEPVPIFVQPTSIFAMSERPSGADVTDVHNDDCCDCGDGCDDCGDCDCDCGDCDCDCGDCDCDGCVLS